MKRYRLRLFRYNNYKSMEEKLSNMAEKGWLLDNVGLFFWTFRKDKPRRLTYDISFFPDGPDLNYYRTEEQETFLEYCEDSGWKLVGTDGHIHVFATDAEHPVSIENDEQLKLENLHRCMKKSPIFNWIWAILFNIFTFFDYDYDLWRKIPSDPELIFTSQFFSSIFFKVFFSLAVVYSLIDYSIWYINAKRAISKGISYERQPSKGKIITEKILAYILIAVMILVYIGAFLNGDVRDMLFLSATFIVVYITFLVAKLLFKKTKLEREIILFVMPCIAFILLLVMLQYS